MTGNQKVDLIISMFIATYTVCCWDPDSSPVCLNEKAKRVDPSRPVLSLPVFFFFVPNLYYSFLFLRSVCMISATPWLHTP